MCDEEEEMDAGTKKAFENDELFEAALRAKHGLGKPDASEGPKSFPNRDRSFEGSVGHGGSNIEMQTSPRFTKKERSREIESFDEY